MKNDEDQLKKKRRDIFSPKRVDAIAPPKIDVPNVDPNLSETLGESDAKTEETKGDCGCGTWVQRFSW